MHAEGYVDGRAHVSSGLYNPGGKRSQEGPEMSGESVGVEHELGVVS
jgi:hypothetical protein